MLWWTVRVLTCRDANRSFHISMPDGMDCKVNPAFPVDILVRVVDVRHAAMISVGGNK